jgi:flagellin
VHFGVDATANSQIDIFAVAGLPVGEMIDMAFILTGTGSPAPVFPAIGVPTVTTLDISTTAAAAQAAVASLDLATDRIIGVRAGVAAAQNRFTRIINTQATVVENLIAAESQIRDADIAAEIALLTRNQILVESATAMVGQANLIPQTVLQLLG